MPKGRLGHARSPRRLPPTPMLPFERKASPSCMGRAIVVNGRISCFACYNGRHHCLSASVRVALQAQRSIAYPSAFRFPSADARRHGALVFKGAVAESAGGFQIEFEDRNLVIRRAAGFLPVMISPTSDMAPRPSVSRQAPRDPPGVEVCSDSVDAFDDTQVAFTRMAIRLLRLLADQPSPLEVAYNKTTLRHPSTR